MWDLIRLAGVSVFRRKNAGVSAAPRISGEVAQYNQSSPPFRVVEPIDDVCKTLSEFANGAQPPEGVEGEGDDEPGGVSLLLAQTRTRVQG